jgi:hypothetical protein
VVRGGAWRRHARFVPLEGVTGDGNALKFPLTREELRSVPKVRVDGRIEAHEAEALSRHYRLVALDQPAPGWDRIEAPSTAAGQAQPPEPSQPLPSPDGSTGPDRRPAATTDPAGWPAPEGPPAEQSAGAERDANDLAARRNREERRDDVDLTAAPVPAGSRAPGPDPRRAQPDVKEENR